MVRRLTGLVAFVVASAWTSSIVLAQVYAPPSPPPGYPAYPTNSNPPTVYPPGYRAPPPDIDLMDDDDDLVPQGTLPQSVVPQGNRANATPSPGPILSPDDPRYARGLPPSAGIPND